MRAAVAVALGLAGCVTRMPSVPPPAAEVAVTTGEGAEGALFLQGFDVMWVQRPHRLSRLRVGVEGRVGEEGLAGTFEAVVQGGTWANGKMASDTPKVSVRYAGLVSDDLVFVPGRVDLVLEGSYGYREARPAAGGATVRVPIPAEAGADAVAVWLTGVDFATAASHPHGYTPRTLSAQLMPPRRAGDAVEIDVFAAFEAAPTLDRVQDLAAYGSHVRVDYVVAFAKGGAARRFGVRAILEHGVDPEGSVPDPDPAHIPVTAPVARGLPEAVAGLSGFAVTLLEDGRADGRYMRALTVGVEDGRYDGARGTYDAVATLRFTNAGRLARRTHVDAAAEFTLLELAHPAEVREGRWSPPVDGQAHRVAYPSMEEIGFD